MAQNDKTPSASQLTTVDLPLYLHAKAKRTATRERTSVAQLIRDGLKDRIEQLDAKFDAEERTRREDREAKRPQGRTLKSLGTLGDRPVSPRSVIETEPDDRLAKIYEEHAKRIAEVISNPQARRQRIADALEAVKREAPLTHPSDETILSSIERAVIRLAREAPPSEPTRIEDDMAGREIDPSRVRAAGDVE